MEHITVGKRYNKGKIAFIECKKNCSLDKINIKNSCFLLIILTQGKLEFQVNGKNITATAPTFICFDEKNEPILLKQSTAIFYAIYFHPCFLNVNMTFDLIRSNKYDDIATTHNMFMLKPFIDNVYTIPIISDLLNKIEHSAIYMTQELEEQRDWYWSCRGRSYFMEIIIALERMYGLMGYGMNRHKPDNVPVIKNPRLRDAIIYIENHYNENISLSDISFNARLNQSALTKLMKEENGCTAIKYLTKYRISVSKKQLAFTDVPIKDIANMVGFKTVQHFNRIFKENVGSTPAEYRKSTVQKRKENLNGK